MTMTAKNIFKIANKLTLLLIYSTYTLLTTSCTQPNLLWKTKIIPNFIFSPVMIDDYLFYKTLDSHIAFINTSTQAVGQDTIVEVAQFHDLATYQGKIYVGNKQGHLLIIEKNLQKMNSFFLNATIYGKIVFENQVAFFQAQRRQQSPVLMAFDLNKRQLLWTTPITGLDNHLNIAIRENTVLLGYTRVFYKIDKKTGKILDQIFHNDILFEGEKKTPLSETALKKVNPDSCFVAHSDSRVCLIDYATNSFLWCSPGGWYMPTSITPERIFYVIREHNKVYAVHNATGKVIWSKKVNFGKFSEVTMVRYKNTLLVNQGKGLVLMDARQGKILKTMTFDENITANLYLHKKKLFVVTGKEMLHCINLPKLLKN